MEKATFLLIRMNSIRKLRFRYAESECRSGTSQNSSLEYFIFGSKF